MKNKILTLLFLLFFPTLFYAQSAFRIALRWADQPIKLTIGNEVCERWRFEGAIFSDEAPTLPWVMRQLPMTGNGEVQIEIVDARFEPFEWNAGADAEQLGENINFVTRVERERNGAVAQIAFVPIVKRGNRYERLIEAAFQVTHQPRLDIRPRGPQNTKVSVLSDGDIYRISVSETGIYRLTYDFLRNRLGIANIDNIDPRTIKIYGNGGGMLPTFVGANRIDDLEENAILIVGEADGKFDPTDFILLYAEGPDQWQFDAANGEFNLQKNLYDNQNYYFIKISAGIGLRVTPQGSLSATDYTVTTFNDFARLEQDKINLLYDWGLTTGRAQGSGQKWYGDRFRIAREYAYDNFFSFPNIVANSPAKVRAEMAVRSTRPSSFILEINGQSITSPQANRVSVLSGDGDNEINYAHTAAINTILEISNPALNVRVRYPPPAGDASSEGWLDFVQINVRRRLVMTGSQMAFRDIETLQYPTATFQLQNANSNLLVWDISNPRRPRNQEYALTGSVLSFGTTTNNLRTFIAFDRNFNFPTPLAAGRVANQNLHGIDDADMAIVFHPEFTAAAQQLAEHRNRHSKLKVALVRIDQIYNEFSSGRRDATAIRDFAKMLHERNASFRYLLLLGDGSFDHRDIYGVGGNFIPVYQTESFNPIFAFPSDDFYAILNGSNPNDPLVGNLTIAVGRLPVKTSAEALAVVNKIVQYETSPTALGDWRNRMVFVADDEDFNQHVRDADKIAEDILRENPFLNLNKIYLDAFPQVSASGGDRFPAAKEELNRSIFRGVLAVTYLGHGGEKGWAQERVLEISDITSWTNADRLPLFITATCSFTGYDNPNFVTAGEETLLNPRGGAIALLTTVRAVFANQNAELTEVALRQIFNRSGGAYPTLGEALRLAKNSITNTSTIVNSRKFALIGDPALRLAIPTMNVRTTRINLQEVTGASADTVRALQRVTVEGHVTDAQGQLLSNFNGIVYPTVFDKKTITSNLVNDAAGLRPSLPFDFSVQRNIIFRGRASVTNGVFRFTFVVPKDINYQFGPGKISYYAASEATMTDGAGSYERLIIGGTSNALADNKGPQVDVFMNTPDFIFGGVTNANPTLLVKLEDENGINVVGNSIGHDLEAVLNNNTQNTFLLNDFYESDLDDFRRGTVRYPLFNLPEGRHEIRVTAWDVANNSAQGYTEFFVASSSEVALERVLNYPNPFTDRTCFQFDHNMAGQPLDVIIQIFTISGRVVKTIQTTIVSDGALRLGDCIEWDGKDDFGDRLARGVYLYKVKVRANLGGSSTIKGESAFEKLVILK